MCGLSPLGAVDAAPKLIEAILASETRGRSRHSQKDELFL
jgi:hypothetical protein